MSAPRTYVVAFSDTRRWQTTVSAASQVDAIEQAESQWDEHGADGEHPFDLIDDCLFDQPEWRIEDAPPPEMEWAIAFFRTAVFHGRVRACTEHEAIGIAKAMVHETDVAMFRRDSIQDSAWRATPLFEGGAA